MLLIVLISAATLAAAAAETADAGANITQAVVSLEHKNGSISLENATIVDAVTNMSENNLIMSTSPEPIISSASNANLTENNANITDSKNLTEIESQRNSSGRAINFNMSEEGSGNMASNNSSIPEKGSLQDLSLDDIDMSSILTTSTDMMHTTLLSPSTTTTKPNGSNVTAMGCMDGDVMYKMGDKFNKSCDEICDCEEGGKVKCRPRCSGPTFRTGTHLNDQFCAEHITKDPCCAVLVCTHDTAPEPLESCTYKNKTYERGDMFNDGCEAVCSCGEAGKMTCKQRCPSVARNTSDKCVALPDPSDPCCTVVRCDVTLGDRDVSDTGTDDHMRARLELLIDEVINGSTVKLGLVGELPSNVTVEVSMDQQKWTPQSMQGLLVMGLKPGHTYYMRANAGGLVSNVVEVILPKEDIHGDNKGKSTVDGCEYKGNNYTLGQEFHDGCDAFCVCSEHGMECADIECPTDFGLDLLDPHCVDWDMHPDGFVPSPPNCCPDDVKCRNNGSCVYAGERFSNWAEISTKLTGCEKRCYCEFGNITCQNVCPPVTATPPADIQCQPHEAILNHLPGDDCCLYWICPALHHPGPGTDDRKPEHHMTGQIQLQPTTGHNISTYNEQTIPGPVQLNTTSEQNFPSSFNGNKTYPDSNMSNIKEHFPGPIDLTKIQLFNKSMNQIPSQNISSYELNIHPLMQENEFLIPIPIYEEHLNHTETSLMAGSNKSMIQKSQPNMGIMTSPNLTHHNKHYSESSSDNETGEELLPYDVQPPFLPGHGLGQPTLWTQERPITHNTLANPHRNKPSTDSEKVLNDQTKPDRGRMPEILHGNKAHDNAPSEEYPEVNLDALLAHLHQQGVLPPEYTIYQRQPPRASNSQAPSRNKPDIDDEIIAHLQEQGLLPPTQTKPHEQYPPQHLQEHRPNIHPPTPPSVLVPPPHIVQRPTSNDPNHNKPDAEPDHNILIHLQEQGFLPLQHGTQQGKHPSKHSHNNKPQQVLDDDILAHFQQGLLPFQHPGPGRPRPVPSQPHPISDEELVLHLQQQGLLPPQYTVHHGIPRQPHVPHQLLLAPAYHHNKSQTEYGVTTLPGGFPPIPNIHSGQQTDEVIVQTLTPLDAFTVRLVFSVPPVLVGLHGRVELRYTSNKLNNDISTWDQQVLAPPKDLIATPQLEFALGGLQPDTEYRIKITVILRDLHNSPSSSILTVRTPSGIPSTTLPPVIAVSPNLSVVEVNTTWVDVVWRKFNEFELQLIDGIQLRYKEVDDKIYAATPLIHRAVTTYTIEGLKPKTQYEVGIFFIPFAGQNTELQADETIHVKTAEIQDLYKFDVNLDVHHVMATSVEINWVGVPYPEDKYVHIFRAIYQSDSDKEDFSTFKVAKRDSQPKTIIKNLIPGTRYRLWLEVYLTNGKIKKSNVQDFSTKPGSTSVVQSSQQGKLESAPSPVNEAGDYYSPLVAVAILAALAIIATLILLLILMRKHGQNKAAISTSRKSQSAYDNPSYKTCEGDPNSANGNGSAKSTATEPA